MGEIKSVITYLLIINTVKTQRLTVFTNKESKRFMYFILII